MGLTVDWDSGLMERAAVAPDVQVGANTWVNGNAGETCMVIQDGVCETPEFRLPGPKADTCLSGSTLASCAGDQGDCRFIDGNNIQPTGENEK